MFIFELLAAFTTVLVVWSVSGILLERAHQLFFNKYGNHFF